MSDDAPAAHLAPVAQKSPVEQKVTAGAAGAGLGGATAALVNWALGRYAFHSDVPGEVEVWIGLAIPAVLAFLAGWLAPHTSRPTGS